MEGTLSNRVKELFRTNPEMVPLLVEYLMTKRELRDKKFEFRLTESSIEIIRKEDAAVQKATNA